MRRLIKTTLDGADGELAFTFDKENIRINKGFVNSEKKLIISPWAENPELKMNQKQADSLDVVEILKRMSFNETGYLARVKYSE